MKVGDVQNRRHAPHLKRKLALLLTAVIVLTGVAWLTREHLSLHQMATQELQLRRAIWAWPWISFAAALVVYYLASLVPGTSGKSIVVGWLFGLWRGVLVVDLALTAAAVTCFLLSRYAVRDLVVTRWRAFLSRLDRAFAENAVFYLLTLRMMHVPFTLVNYGAGASDVPTSTFAWTTAVGLLPGTLLFVFLGTQIPTLRELATDGAGHLLDPGLVGALVGMGFLPLAARWIVQRLRCLFVRAVPPGVTPT
jgi:uncharacterized membrane protein YdjX (TVP38/TMEM64 family)